MGRRDTFHLSHPPSSGQCEAAPYLEVDVSLCFFWPWFRAAQLAKQWEVGKGRCFDSSRRQRGGGVIRILKHSFAIQVWFSSLLLHSEPSGQCVAFMLLPGVQPSLTSLPAFFHLGFTPLHQKLADKEDTRQGMKAGGQPLLWLGVKRGSVSRMSNQATESPCGCGKHVMWKQTFLDQMKHPIRDSEKTEAL